MPNTPVDPFDPTRMHIKLHLSPTQYDRIVAAAAKAGMRVNTWMRMRLLECADEQERKRS